jgi:hypothetical protein
MKLEEIYQFVPKDVMFGSDPIFLNAIMSQPK